MRILGLAAQGARLLPWPVVSTYPHQLQGEVEPTPRRHLRKDAVHPFSDVAEANVATASVGKVRGLPGSSIVLGRS